MPTLSGTGTATTVLQPRYMMSQLTYASSGTRIMIWIDGGMDDERSRTTFILTQIS